MLRHIPFVLLVFVLTSSAFPSYNTTDIRNRWEDEIAVFDQLNKQPQPQNAILFYGSSSIRMWDDIEEDMSPYPVIRRGYGGAALHDAAHYARRVLTPLDYRALVIFVANDIWGTANDKSPAEMERLMDKIVQTSRRHRPGAPVFIIEVTHIPARAHLIEAWDAANAHLKAYANALDGVHFIPTRDLYLCAGDRVRAELFQADGIHQNESGYAIWKDRIKSKIDEVMRKKA
ncbi:MAG: GDSL-type esterase/lipase family protein [Bacteroidota bacterium]